MPEIKTRDVVKGTVKTLDKAAVAGERMKQAYIRTKDKAEQGMYSAESAPEEYATDRVSGGAEAAAYEAAHQFDKHGRKAVKTTKDNISTVREQMEQRKANQPKRQAQKQAQKKAQRKAAGTARSSPSAPAAQPPAPTGSGSTVRPSIKTAQRGSIQQPAKSTGTSAIKTAKGTVKTARRSIKTPAQTTRTTVKTAQAAMAAQKNAQAAAKASHRAVQAAKAAARKSAEAARKTARATVSAVRAIIAGTKALITALIAGGWIAVVIILIVVLLGCAVSLFGGGSSSNSYTPVSAEVEAYEPLIRQYAAQYGIPEYVELIKAVMMQESGGQGSDPMQASECGYNTRYPNTPGGITDPEYSIDVGIQNLAACLNVAEVENPIDMEHIKLALQGYNFGNGYISWAKSSYGGYSYANAVEFSVTQAERLGWDSYGDTQYVSHVLALLPLRAGVYQRRQPSHRGGGPDPARQRGRGILLVLVRL